MALDLQDAVGRQYPLVARQKFTYADLESGVAELAAGLPGGAIVIGGGVVVIEAWNSAGGTTPADNLDVGDGNDIDRYGASIDLRTLGHTALILDGHKYTAPDTVDLIWTPNADTTTAPTAGEAFVYLEYMLESRANEVQPV